MLPPSSSCSAVVNSVRKLLLIFPSKPLAHRSEDSLVCLVIHLSAVGLTVVRHFPFFIQKIKQKRFKCLPPCYVSFSFLAGSFKFLLHTSIFSCTKTQSGSLCCFLLCSVQLCCCISIKYPGETHGFRMQPTLWNVKMCMIIMNFIICFIYLRQWLVG